MNSFQSTDIYNELNTTFNNYINGKNINDINNYFIEEQYSNLFDSVDNAKIKKMIEKDIFSVITYINYNYNKEYDENIPIDSITNKDKILYILMYYITKELVYEHKKN